MGNKMRLKKWEKREVDILHANWNIPMRELLVFLPDRTQQTIYWKLGVLGYNRETYKRYAPEDDSYISENYKAKGNFELGRDIKRTSKSIAKRMIVLGLSRTDEDLKLLAKSNRGCFKPGTASPKAFEQGMLQLTLDESTGKSFYNIKIWQKFMRLNRYLYEQYHNVILSKDDIIHSQDGNPMNILKENMVLITRSEMLAKNNMTDSALLKRIFKVKDPEMAEKIKAEMPELIELKRNTILLNKEIKKQNAE